ncbi:MFS transporter [Acidocella sp.]|jgi:MFS family permease|uniref:MFS transporter n=1 Tax=Acidocella sp. TaxID=50710 RepID=UPI002F40A927
MPHSGFKPLDDQPFKGFHWRAVFTTGMGVFTDGYDLASIGVVLPLVLASFGVGHIGGLDGALLAGSALLGAALGALIFGFLGQRGRKTFYGLDVAIMTIAAVAQIFAPNLMWLIAIRFILGIGVGADYVLSPTIMAEHANRADRGRSIGFGFSVTWWMGGAVAGLLLLVLHACGVAPGLTWRIVLAAGALPALSVLYLRRQMPETTRYLARMEGDTEAARAVTVTVTGRAQAVPPVDRRSFMTVFRAHAGQIFAAALLWFVFDIVIYSTVLFGPSLIAKGLGITPASFTLLMDLGFIMPAVLIGTFFLLDRFGRKPVMIWGYIGAALVLILFAVLHRDIMHNAVLGLVIFGAFNMLIMGPSMVSGSGILGVELAPTRIRTVAQSITVVGGRLGASLSAFVFPLVFMKLGEEAAIAILAGLSIVGAILTLTLIPETAGRSLEDLSGEVMEAAAAE